MVTTIPQEQTTHEIQFAWVESTIITSTKMQIPSIINTISPLVITMIKDMVSREHQFARIKHGTWYP
jgi:hypothetical protein